MGRLTPLGEQLYGVTDNDKAKEIERKFYSRMGIDQGSSDGDHSPEHCVPSCRECGSLDNLTRGYECAKLIYICSPCIKKIYDLGTFREDRVVVTETPRCNGKSWVKETFEGMNTWQKLDYLDKSVNSLYNLPKPKRKRHVLKRYKRSRYND